MVRLLAPPNNPGRSVTGFRALTVCVCLVLGAAMVSTVAAQTPSFAPVAPIRSFEVVAEYPHDPEAFTQGLMLVDGQLYEGTGMNGASELRLVDLQTGEVIRHHALDDEHFGEGI